MSRFDNPSAMQESEYNFTAEANPASKFDATEIVKAGEGQFVSHLQQADLRTLIAYIEQYGGKIGKIEGLPKEWKERLEAEKKQKAGALTINPKLYFVSKNKVLELAVAELRKRLTGQEQN